MSKKILFVNPVTREEGSLVTDRETRFPPLGLVLLAALTPPEWEVELIDENFNAFDVRQADLVALSAMTATVNRAYEIASLYKKEGIPVVLGGIHASMRPDEALSYVDSVVIGEGEDVWRELLQDARAGKLRRRYGGTRASMKDTPFPRRDLLSPRYRMGSIQTARGCPHGCEFCSVTLFNGRSYRPRPIMHVIEELRTITQKVVFFLDDNIIGPDEPSRTRAGLLFDAMKHNGIGKLWLGQATVDFAAEEKLMRKAYESGCRIVFIGFESIHDKSLREMGKLVNLARGIGHYRECIKRLHGQGIAVWGNFILGHDSDDRAVLENTRKFIIESGIDLITFSCLTPLPGTRLFERLDREKRIMYQNYPRDWHRYSFTDVVFKPRHMTPSELDLGIKAIAGGVFTPFQPERTLVRSLRVNKSLTAALMAYTMNRAFQRTAKMIMARKEKQWCSGCTAGKETGTMS